MADDITLAKSGQFRIFVQPDGSSPANPYQYVGCLNLGGFQEDLGTGEPIYCPSSEVAGAFDIVDVTNPPPSLATTDWTQHADIRLNEFWWKLRKTRCEFNFIVKGSNCARPDDPDDFQSKIIGRRAKLTAFNTGSLNGVQEDAAVDLTGTLQVLAYDRFLPIGFGEVAENYVFSNALDGIYADKIQCGNCGSQSDGCQKLYVLTSTITASPALASQVAYSKDGGRTWAFDNINSLSTSAGNKIAQIGTRLVVISRTALSHNYKSQSSVDAGVSSGWTAVTSGYVASKGPNAIWSKSPSETYIAAQGGYVYFMSNPVLPVKILTDGTVTTQNLNDIRGKKNTIVAVGASNAVIVSRNQGKTWALVTGPAVGVALNTVEVISDTVWMIGADNGKSFYTVDGGTSWVEMTPDGDLTHVNMIRFVDEVVGYMAAQTSGAVRVYRTADNGNTWHSTAPYVSDVPTADHYNFVAPCPGNYNTVMIGGLAGDTTDGIVALGLA